MPQASEQSCVWSEPNALLVLRLVWPLSGKSGVIKIKLKLS